MHKMKQYDPAGKQYLNSYVCKGTIERDSVQEKSADNNTYEFQ